jgi:hypothetical protein
MSSTYRSIGFDRYDNDDDFIDTEPTPIFTPSEICAEAMLTVRLLDFIDDCDNSNGVNGGAKVKPLKIPLLSDVVTTLFSNLKLDLIFV